MIYLNKIEVYWGDDCTTLEEPIAIFNEGAIILDEGGEYVTCVKSKRESYYLPTMFISKAAFNVLKTLNPPEPSENVVYLRKLLKEIYKGDQK